MTPTSIETVNGHFVDLVNPDARTIDIRDIAWATSRMPRYVGHTVSAIPYTIGQHSIFVTQLVQRLFDHQKTDLRQTFFDTLSERIRKIAPTHPNPKDIIEEVHAILGGAPPAKLLLECLMHDGSEAYIVDVPTPLKQADGFRQVYMAHEDKMMKTIRQAFNMGELEPEYEVFVNWADQAALTVEAYHLIKSRGANWTRLLPLGMVELQNFDQPKPAIEVYEDFLNWFEELTIHP